MDENINITNLEQKSNYIKFIENIVFADIQERDQTIDDSNFYFNVILKDEISSVPNFVLLKNEQDKDILGNPTCEINNKIVQCSYEDLQLLKDNNGNYQVYYINQCNEKIKVNISVKVTIQNTHKQFGSGKFMKSILLNLFLILLFML